jgi:ankyrin repeat protein
MVIHHYSYASRNGNYKIAELLVNAGADIDATNDDGYNAYTLAKKNGHENILALFKRVRKSKHTGKQIQDAPPTYASTFDDSSVYSVDYSSE